MPEYRNSQGYQSQGQNRPVRQQNPNYRPSPQGNMPQRRPAGQQPQMPIRQAPSQMPIRQAPSRRPSGYYGAQKPRRRRRPTPFLIILIVFLIILLIVVFTSKSFKNFIGGFGKEETDTETEEVTETDEITETEEVTEPVTEEETVLPPEDDEFLICIDPGHGFGDVGASSELLGDITEKDINLYVAKEVYELLKKAGYNVILSHDGETLPVSPIDDGDNLFYIDERVAYVNAKKVDLFVSVHCDSFGSDQSVYGTRIYYCANYKHTDEATALAETVKRAVNEAFPDYKEARTFGKPMAEAYYVTYETNAPAVLIELGFISNEDDAARMLDEEWRADMAYAIANAISVYLHESNTETN